MMQWKRQPIPPPGLKAIFLEALFLSCVTLLVLLVFQPFGTYEYRHTYKYLQLAGYGLLSLLVYPVSRLLLLQIMRREQKYYLGQEAIVLGCSLLILSFGAFLYHACVILNYFNWSRFGLFMLYGISVGVIPFGIVFYSKWLRYRQTKAEPDSNEKTAQPPQPEAKTITITGQNKSESISINPDEVYYLKSSGNYVEIYLIKDGKLKAELIRNTLSNVSSQLPADQFTSVHRSYVANNLHFNKLIREDASYRLAGTAHEIRLPVSRNLAPALETKLNHAPALTENSEHPSQKPAFRH